MNAETGQTNEQETISIAEAADVAVCRRRASHLAATLKFSDTGVGEVAILATELAENVLRHGGGRGEFRIGRLNGERDRAGIEIACSDSGPGVERETAFADGFSTRGSLGIGLGAVARMADSVDIATPASGHGVEILCRKWLADGTAPRSEARNADASPIPVEVGARSRPCPGFSVNGDAYVIRFPGRRRVLAAVIDGLGHGPSAHEASLAAQQYIEEHSSMDLPVLFEGMHLRLRRTRGAVAGAVAMDPDAGTLQFLGVGNIEAVVLMGEESTQMVSVGGIVGHNMRTLRPFEYPWTDGGTVVLCSDGIRGAWRGGLPAEIRTGHPDLMAETIIKEFSRETDDATVIGIRKRD